jgi:hypothetical protein
MDHKRSRQEESRGDLGLSGFTTIQQPAGLQQFRTGCPVNGPVHSASPQEALVGRIDNGIHLHGGNVSLNKFYGCIHVCYMPLTEAPSSDSKARAIRSMTLSICLSVKVLFSSSRVKERA